MKFNHVKRICCRNEAERSRPQPLEPDSNWLQLITVACAQMLSNDIPAVNVFGGLATIGS